MNIIAHLELTDGEKNLLRDGLSEHRLFLTDENKPEDYQVFRKSADVIFGNVEPADLLQMPGLKWLQLESVGFNPYQSLELPSHMVVSNMRGIHAITVAETAVAGILGLFRGLHRLINLRTEGEWVGDPLRPTLRTVSDSRIVILGAGAIGRQCGEALSQLGGGVIFYDRFVEGESVIQSVQDLESSLSQADVLLNCLPETPETIGLLNDGLLDRLAETAVFVNVGRSSIVDEDLLVVRLQTSKLAGCVLDVTQEEPLPSKHPFWKTPNTILTQHTGGGSLTEQETKIRLFLKNFARFERGERVENIIDLKRGF